MTVYLFAGIPVGDFAAALAWYEKLLGGPPSFFPHDTEAVWQLAEHQLVYVVQRPERAGRGLEPAGRETYPDGVRKITYAGPEGNEIGFGEVPAE